MRIEMHRHPASIGWAVVALFPVIAGRDLSEVVGIDLAFTDQER
jgi:hypothetical protein